MIVIACLPPWTKYLNDTIQILAQIREEINNGNYDSAWQSRELKRSIELLQSLRDDLSLLPEKINKIVSIYTD